MVLYKWRHGHWQGEEPTIISVVLSSITTLSTTFLMTRPTTQSRWLVYCIITFKSIAIFKSNISLSLNFQAYVYTFIFEINCYFYNKLISTEFMPYLKPYFIFCFLLFKIYLWIFLINSYEPFGSGKLIWI